jgi:hypothetical protein
VGGRSVEYFEINKEGFVKAEEKKQVARNPALTLLKDNWLGVIQAAGRSPRWNAGLHLVLSLMPIFLAL